MLLALIVSSPACKAAGTLPEILVKTCDPGDILVRAMRKMAADERAASPGSTVTLTCLDDLERVLLLQRLDTVRKETKKMGVFNSATLQMCEIALDGILVA